MANDSLMTITEVLNAVRGKFVGFARNYKNFYFSSVVTDSRFVTDGSLFVPLVGEFQDGHKYIPQAVEKGATVVFVSQYSYRENENKYMEIAADNGHLALIVVENTLTALQNAAHGYLAKFPNLIKVSVTGSSGKTTTKEILRSLLSQKFSVISNKGNLNSETGLPLSVFTIRNHHEIALLEMGMNRENEIGELADCFRPEFALITNIGTAHVGLLGSREKIAEEKKKIFNYIGKIGVAVIPEDDDFKDFLSFGIEGKVVYYGIHNESSGVKFLKDEGLKGTSFLVNGEKCHLALPGIYNYKNAVAAIALAKELSLTSSEIKAGFDTIQPVFGRSQIVNGRITIMQDCYNANPDSMEKSIEFCSSFHHNGQKIFILGDMLELGDASLSNHVGVMRNALESGSDVLVFVGGEMKKAWDEINSKGYANEIAFDANKTKVLVYPEHDDAAIAKIGSEIKNIVKDGDFVLLKASRGLALERLREYLD